MLFAQKIFRTILTNQRLFNTDTTTSTFKITWPISNPVILLMRTVFQTCFLNKLVFFGFNLKGVDKFGVGCVIKRDASGDSREVRGVLSAGF